MEEKKENKNDDGDVVNDKKETNNNYNFGLRFNYHGKSIMNHYDHNNLSPKYVDLKSEITCNKICKLSMNSFNDSYQKALILIMNSSHIKNVKCTYNLGYDINLDSSLNINHILSIIFYCDFDNLS